MKYIYGPVKSRRLGYSLGLSLTPYKVCSFDCVYCQAGRTTHKTDQRKEYIPINEILDELKAWIAGNPLPIKDLQYITLSGTGEPTLNIKAGQLITEIKKLITVPVAVISNASLFSDPSVRRELLSADLIVPSLDAANDKVLERVDRPGIPIKSEDIINGIVALRKEYRGKLWLEVMLVKGLNDDLRHIRKLKDAIDRINPDKIQINSPVRTTADSYIYSVAKPKLIKIKEIFGDKCEIV